MKRAVKWIASLAAVIVAVLLGLSAIIGFVMSAGSTRTVYSRALSPDGALEARVQFDDCGGACNFSRVVFIKRHWLDDQPWLSCRAFWAKGEEPVSLEWAGNRTLLIRRGFRANDIQHALGDCGMWRWKPSSRISKLSP